MRRECWLCKMGWNVRAWFLCVVGSSTAWRWGHCTSGSGTRRSGGPALHLGQPAIAPSAPVKRLHLFSCIGFALLTLASSVSGQLTVDFTPGGQALSLSASNLTLAIRVDAGGTAHLEAATVDDATPLSGLQPEVRGTLPVLAGSSFRLSVAGIKQVDTRSTNLGASLSGGTMNCAPEGLGIDSNPNGSGTGPGEGFGLSLDTTGIGPNLRLRFTQVELNNFQADQGGFVNRATLDERSTSGNGNAVYDFVVSGVEAGLDGGHPATQVATYYSKVDGHRLQALTLDAFETAAQFNNPVLEDLADPMMFRETNSSTGGVTYYLAATSFSRFKSQDMVHWQRLSNWSDVNQAKSWAGSSNQPLSGVWACELIKKAPLYYLYFSAVKPSGDKRVIYVATSGNVEGVFTIQPIPVVELSTNNAIDPDPFLDPASGNYYLYYTQDQGTDPQHIARIYAMQLSDNLLGLRSGTSPSLCLEAQTQAWEYRWLEGPAVREHNGYYYLFYSSQCYCGASYSVGYATSASPKGEVWTKYAANPVLKQDSSALGKVSGPGHNNLVKGPDGVEDWIVYHAHIATAAGGQRHTCIDRYHFEPSPTGGPDVVVMDGPTLAKQPLPAGAKPRVAVTPIETFDNTNALVRSRWLKVRDENSAYYQLTGTQLLVQPKSGALFTAGVDPQAGNVILQYAPASGDWFAGTSLLFNGIPTTRLADVFGGLVAWQDAQHYVAARADARGHLWLETCNQTFGNTEVAATVDCGAPVVNPQFLRLVYSEALRQFSFQASSNGLVYTQVGSVASPLSPERFTYVGPIAYSGAQTSSVTGAEVRFNWFQLDDPRTLRYLPPWVGQDIGGSSLAGATFSTGAGAFTVVGAGADIAGLVDQFHLASRTLIGNGEIIARVAGLEATDPLAKAGVMMRESSAAGARNVLVALAPYTRLVQSRPQTSGATTTIATGPVSSPWLRLARQGDLFTAYSSTDGATWTAFGPAQTISMTTNILVGLAVTSRNTTKLCSAQFSNLQVLQYYRWPLDTNATDVLGGLTGSGQGTPAFVPDHIVGSGSLRLDGNSSLLLAPHPALQNETFAYTLSFWFKPARLQGLQVLYEEGGAPDGLAVRLNGANLEAGLAAASARSTVSLPGITSNVWQFATVTFDGTSGNPGKLAMYCNGQSTANSNAPASIPTHADNSAIGGVSGTYAFADSGGRFMGSLDDLRLTEGAALPADFTDRDGDGLPDAQELMLGTDPAKWDTDGDGISDGFEVLYAGTDPLSDQDGFKITVVPALGGFVIPSTSAFNFVFQQWNPATGQWTNRAGPFTTTGSPTLVTLQQLGYSAAESTVLLRVKVGD
jgi:GH43 family beta-xylosidase